MKKSTLIAVLVVVALVVSMIAWQVSKQSQETVSGAEAELTPSEQTALEGGPNAIDEDTEFSDSSLDDLGK